MNKAGANKGIASLIVLLLVLVLASAFVVFYIFKSMKPIPENFDGNISGVVPVTPKLNEENKEKSSSGIIAYFKGNQEVWIYKLTNGEGFKVLPEINTEKYCGEGCASRFIDVSNDNKGIVADLLDKDDKSYIGYVDLKNPLKIEYLVEGSRPSWNPYASEFIYEGKDGKLATFNFKERTSKEIPTGIRYPLAWLSKDEVVYLDESFGEIVYTGNIRSGVIGFVTIEGAGSITNVSLSPDKKYYLLSVLRGEGYDVGLAKIDGTGYKSISGFKGEAWPGSGYYFGVWSPDSTRIAIKDWFIDKVTRVNGTRALKIVDINGNFIKEYDAKTTAERNLCWIGINGSEFLITASTDDQKNYISIFNLKNDSVKEIENLYSPDSSGFVCK